MTITLVSVKGSALTIPEFDGNFQDLDGRLEYFETGTGQPGASIVNVTAAGNVITFHMSDATTFSVVIPASVLTFRGEWATNTLYNAMDIVVGPEGTLYSKNRYLVNIDHTSDPTTFDPGENTASQDFYILLMPSELARTQTVTTATFDPSLVEAQSYNRCTNASGCVVTIPDDDTQDFPIDSELHFRQCDDDAVSFVGESTGVTINYADDENPQTAIRGAVCTIKKIGANEWDLFGRLEIASA